MRDKQATAREYVNASFDDALKALDDVTELLPHAGLPKSPKLDSELKKAHAALAAAQRIVSELADEK